MPGPRAPVRVLHVITGLDPGGAELMLERLIRASDGARFRHAAVSITDVGPVGRRLAEDGVAVSSLGLGSGAGAPGALIRLAGQIRTARPDLVQCWMYHGNLLGGLAAKLAGTGPVLWNIRQSTLDPVHSRRSTIWVCRAGGWLSRRLPARIVCCSESAARHHAGLGYDAARMVVIPNGFDTGRFRPDARAGRALRAELGIAGSAPLVGAVGRSHPQKDYPTFVQAAARLAAAVPEVHFLFCGEGLDGENRSLAALIEAAGLAGRFDLLGRRDDVAAVMAALDVCASSSAFGEGFPNVIGEAMACGVPCVVTDVGDSAFLVGDTGRVVAPGDAEALAAAWRDLVAMDEGGRRALGARARARIEHAFALADVVARYDALYEEVVVGRSAKDGAMATGR